MHLPTNRSVRATVQRVTAENLHLNSTFVNKFTDLESSLSDRDTVFCDSSRSAFAQALGASDCPDIQKDLCVRDESEREQIRTAWKQHHAAKKSNDSVALATANRLIRRLVSRRRNQRQMRRARAILDTATAAPKLHWQLLQQNAHDPGAPAEGRCKLLDRLNDKDGNFISTDKMEIREHLLNYRRSVFQIRSDFGDEFLDSIHADLLLLSRVNSDILEQTPSINNLESAAAQSSVDARSAWRGMSREFNASHRNQAGAMFERFRNTRASFQSQCLQLEAPFQLAELQSSLLGLEDTGPGVDGVAPASFKFLQNDTQHLLLDCLNHIWSTGIVPD
jgi:hypothetical protein